MAMNSPVSGLLVGKWMASCPDGVPWWRVLKADGTLAVGKRDPRFAAEQIQKLEEEGIEFVGDSCPRQFFFVP
jgi:alkylated DNA nucleotide flippase Atl1